MTLPTRPEFKRGQIYYINDDPDNKPVGAEIWPNRLGVIVSANASNMTSDVVEIIYLTTSFKKKVGPTHVIVQSKKKQAIALCEQIHSVDKIRLGDYTNDISKYEQQAIDMAMLFSLQIAPSIEILSVFKKWEHYINKYCLSVIDEQKCIKQRLMSDKKTNDMIDQLIKERDSYKILYESRMKLLNDIADKAKQ